MQGIAVGWSDVANIMEIYNPVTKQLYTTTVYKLDEHNNTKSHFNLSYDGGILSGLFSMDSQQNVPEPYPIGTAVTISAPEGQSPGYILAVPSAKSTPGDPPYTIQLISGYTTSVPLSVMEKLFTDQSSPPAQLTLPSWLQHDAKVRPTLSLSIDTTRPPPFVPRQ